MNPSFSFRKLCRQTISLLVRFLPSGKITEILIWPISRRLFGHGYTEIVEIDPGLRMKVYGDMPDMVNKSLLFMSGYKRLAWEPATARLVASLSPEVAVVAGSHLGYYPLIIAKHFPGARVYAFEPNPGNYARFSENITLNGLSNITPVPLALGDVQEEALMYFDFGQSSLLDSERAHSGKGTVLVDTLDHFFIDKPKDPDLMIFDAEGYEPNIIKGASALIERSRPDIILEINPKTIRIAGSDQRMLCDLLIDRGYSIFVIQDNYHHELNDRADTHIQLKEFNDMSVGDMPFVNVFATIHPERVKQYLVSHEEK